MYWKKAWRQLHNFATSDTEQILESTSYKRATVRPPITYLKKNIQIRWTRHEGHWNKDEHLSFVPLWTLSRVRTYLGRPARYYLQHHCVDIGCSLEDLTEALGDRDELLERESGKSVAGAGHDIYIYILGQRKLYYYYYYYYLHWSFSYPR